MDEDLQEVARALLAAGCKELVRKDAPVEPALELMDAALLLSPFLRVYAVRVLIRQRGFEDQRPMGVECALARLFGGQSAHPHNNVPSPLALMPVGQAGISM